MTVGNRTAEIEAKTDRVRRWLVEVGSPGVVLRQRSNFAWLTGGGRSQVNSAKSTGVGSVLITADRVVLLASNIESARLASEEIADGPIECAEYPWHQPEGESRLLERLTGGASAVVSDDDSAVAAAMRGLRASLLPPEVERYRELGALTAAIAEDVCFALAPGETEYEVAARVYAAAASQGIDVPVCLVAADGRIVTRRHPLPTSALVRERAMVVVCLERQGLICSATRLVNFVPADPALRRRHDAVCEVDATAIDATRVGRSIGDIFGEIQGAYGATGFADEWRQHHQGGSTGYQPRDIIAAPDVTATVQPNQAFAWNPSIAGTKSEDTMLATDEGPKWITQPGPQWPSLQVARGGGSFRRADILIRG